MKNKIEPLIKGSPKGSNLVNNFVKGPSTAAPCANAPSKNSRTGPDEKKIIKKIKKDLIREGGAEIPELKKRVEEMEEREIAKRQESLQNDPADKYLEKKAKRHQKQAEELRKDAASALNKKHNQTTKGRAKTRIN